MFYQQIGFVIISLMIVWLEYTSFPRTKMKYKIITFMCSMVLFNIMAFVLRTMIIMR